MERESEAQRPVRLEEIGHPRGTLAILVIYGALFGLAWLSLFFFEFLPRGAPHP